MQSSTNANHKELWLAHRILQSTLDDHDYPAEEGDKKKVTVPRRERRDLRSAPKAFDLDSRIRGIHDEAIRTPEGQECLRLLGRDLISYGVKLHREAVWSLAEMSRQVFSPKGAMYDRSSHEDSRSAYILPWEATRSAVERSRREWCPSLYRAHPRSLRSDPARGNIRTQVNTTPNSDDHLLVMPGQDGSQDSPSDSMVEKPMVAESGVRGSGMLVLGEAC